MLFFGDSAANGVKASTYVTELHSRADFEAFVAQQNEKVGGRAGGRAGGWRAVDLWCAR